MKKQWWHGKVAYQIYPKSFRDSNGDGIGDLRGIIEKLDYLKDLGIDIIWISPIYQSPFVDQGYDISDYYQIDPAFGTMDDFDELMREAKKRDMYILMDLVINHCSDKHEWFKKALADPEGEYGEYFYFEKGKDGKVPSNYRSYFGGSVWESVPGTDLYYLHFFAKEQPDLNWENEKVREELFRMVNWWLDKGLAGFRIDAIMNIKKDTRFPDYEPDGNDGMVRCSRMVEEVKGIGDFLGELKRETFAKHNAFTVAEVFNMRKEELKEFIGEEGHFSTMFDFAALDTMAGGHGWYDAPEYDFFKWRTALFNAQEKYQGEVFLANIIENHDEPRGASTYLPAYAQNDEGTKMLATTSILLWGLPFLYQGQEIGMTNCRMKDIAEYDDIDTKNQYRIAMEAGLSQEEALQLCFKHSRDNARTPMQWSGEANAGFSTGSPWLKVNPNYVEKNVEAEENDASSVLSYYKKLLSLRKAEGYREVFTYGDFRPDFEKEGMVFAYHRSNEEQDILIAANFGLQEVKLELGRCGEILLKNQEGVGLEDKRLTLPSCGVAVVDL
ncbi:MAG: alpha-glucosidase [Lachnospiraceae bacterium]|jgi:oligo-1,6-glucosidase|nr:alpha-glucosidase [Lachnospiraceae bacterium]MCI9343502.1 alpha-glucosidase [Lachnospiraceae bacterium]